MDTASVNRAGQEKQRPEQWIILPGTTIGGEVGTFNVDFVIWNRGRSRSLTLNGVVDTGASYTLVPASVLDEMGIERLQSKVFSLADGSRIKLSLGWVEMELEGETGHVHIVFGPDNGKVLLGAIALETFALAADAKYRRLIPAELTL